MTTGVKNRKNRISVLLWSALIIGSVGASENIKSSKDSNSKNHKTKEIYE